ncbi:MAG: superoxide dismutase [Ni], partial [Patescibacteria group bacterium]
FKTMKLASKARQEINIDAANELLDAVQKIAEIFWRTKNIKTAKISAPYPSGGTILIPKS